MVNIKIGVVVVVEKSYKAIPKKYKHKKNTSQQQTYITKGKTV